MFVIMPMVIGLKMIVFEARAETLSKYMPRAGDHCVKGEVAVEVHLQLAGAEGLGEIYLFTNEVHFQLVEGEELGEIHILAEGEERGVWYVGVGSWFVMP